MDLAVLSDIHGNYIAFEKCVEYALSRGVKSFAFLGDYVGELAYPEKTMKMIFEMAEKYDCYFIKGNKEDYWIDYYNNGELGWKDKDSTTGSLLYTYQHLVEKDLNFFKGLPISKKISIKNMPSFTICHGSPYAANQKLVPDNDKIFETLNAVDTSMIICGHTHIQAKFDINGKTVLNAGSVGVPLYSNRKSQFLILHQIDKQWKEEFISMEYDVEKVIEELHLSGLNKLAPYWCIMTENLLRNGNIPHSAALKRAMALCNAETGTCIWPDIPEKYWRQAVEDILVSKQMKV